MHSTDSAYATAQSESGHAQLSVSWWRNHLDRRFWSLTVLGVADAEIFMGDTAVLRCVVNDFGDLVRVS